MNDPLAVLALALLGALLGGVVGALFVARRNRAEGDRLRRRLDELEERVEDRISEPAPDQRGYLITAVGTEPAEPAGPAEGFVPARIEGRLFADLVLRESVVKAAALTHGLRRALAPETRNRIRFEMRREIKRTRKQRRADQKTARREWEARQRENLDEDAA